MVKNSKHTPGPWFIAFEHEVEEKGGYLKREIWTEKRDCPVFTSYLDKKIGKTHDHLSSEMSDEEFMANAKLICAAPDLFNACKLLLEANSEEECNFSGQLDRAIESAEMALKKAGFLE